MFEWLKRIKKQVKSYFYLVTAIDRNQQYIWQLPKDVSYQQASIFARELRRMKKRDIVVTPPIKIKPAKSVKYLLQSDTHIRSKTALLNTIKQALGDDWQNTSLLKIEYGVVIVEKCYEVINYGKRQPKKEKKR